MEWPCVETRHDSRSRLTVVVVAAILMMAQPCCCYIRVKEEKPEVYIRLRMHQRIFDAAQPLGWWGNAEHVEDTNCLAGNINDRTFVILTIATARVTYGGGFQTPTNTDCSVDSTAMMASVSDLNGEIGRAHV